jgi:hypothetical protein
MLFNSQRTCWNEPLTQGATIMNTSTSLNPMRRLARLATGAIATSLAAGSLAFASAAPAQAFTGCEGDCFTNTFISQYLENKVQVQVRAKTSVPANVRAEVSDLTGKVVATMTETAGVFTTDHSIATQAYVLPQGKSFVVKVKATDANGKSFTKAYGIKSLERTVTVTLQTISISEDSDYGAGELAAAIKIGNTVSTVFTRRSITAPYTKTFNTKFVGRQTGEFTPIKIEINDDDCEGFCEFGSGFSFTSGSNSEWDWTTGSYLMYNDHVPGTRTDSFAVAGNGALRFAATGTFSVTIA